MEERIDHAAEARKIMHEVGHDEHGTVALELLDDTERWVYDATMREAQVHATLALVEQQRIGNLIATGQYRIDPSDRYFRSWLDDARAALAALEEGAEHDHH